MIKISEDSAMFADVMHAYDCGKTLIFRDQQQPSDAWQPLPGNPVVELRDMLERQLRAHRDLFELSVEWSYEDPESFGRLPPEHREQFLESARVVADLDRAYLENGAPYVTLAQARAIARVDCPLRETHAKGNA